jgi:hypothetical protein
MAYALPSDGQLWPMPFLLMGNYGLCPSF